jgi:hypothetical protein
MVSEILIIKTRGAKFREMNDDSAPLIEAIRIKYYGAIKLLRS